MFTNGRNPAILSGMDSETLILILAPLGFLIIFPLFWSAIVFFISRLGGWATIAAEYPYREPLAADCMPLQSAILRFNNSYNGVLKICADDEGLYFSVFFPFRPGHEPFFVPWEEISGQRSGYFIYRMVDLRFERTPDIPFRLYKRNADKLVEAVNGRWTYQE